MLKVRYLQSWATSFPSNGSACPPTGLPVRTLVLGGREAVVKTKQQTQRPIEIPCCACSYVSGIVVPETSHPWTNSTIGVALVGASLISSKHHIYMCVLHGIHCIPTACVPSGCSLLFYQDQVLRYLYSKHLQGSL